MRFFESKLKVTVSDNSNLSKTFDIATGSKGSICSIETFNQNEKKVNIAAAGVTGNNGTMKVTIPNELLSGDFKVLIDNKEQQFGTEMINGNSTRISFDLDFTETNAAQIEIIGTEVIPEFGSAFPLAIVLATSISGLVLWSRWVRGGRRIALKSSHL